MTKQESTPSFASTYNVNPDEGQALLDKIAEDAFADELLALGVPVQTPEQLQQLLKLAEHVQRQGKRESLLDKKIAAAMNKLAGASNDNALATYVEQRKHADANIAVELARQPDHAASILAAIEKYSPKN
jgi:hypothetical protein